jgi:AcrR family transcriptional regulator
MRDTKQKIAAGLEHAFAKGGFAEPSVDDLRVAADVSLRTLYKYAPSRAEMVHIALEHRHQRYLTVVFTDLPTEPDKVLRVAIDRVGYWMNSEASHGCLFHSAVAAAPNDPVLQELLVRHKSEIANTIAQKSHRTGLEVEINLILEGLTQSYPIHGEEAVFAAQRLAMSLPVTSSS